MHVSGAIDITEPIIDKASKGIAKTSAVPVQGLLRRFRWRFLSALCLVFFYIYFMYTYWWRCARSIRSLHCLLMLLSGLVLRF